MTGRAYRKPAEVAHRMGPFAGYRPNAAAMIGVIAKHRAAVGNIDHTEVVPDDLLAAARRAWDDALDLGEVHGFPNAQRTAPRPAAPSETASSRRAADSCGCAPSATPSGRSGRTSTSRWRRTRGRAGRRAS